MTNPAGYSRVQIALHWIVVLLIVQQYLLKDGIADAWEASRAGLEVPFDPLVAVHVAGGALIMAFALWRLVLRARRGAPAAVGSAKLQMLARLTHAGLYALMILMPVTGAMAWFGGVEAAAQGHNLLKVVLLVLVALHVVGALYHHFVLKDAMLDRMRRAQP